MRSFFWVQTLAIFVGICGFSVLSFFLFFQRASLLRSKKSSAHLVGNSPQIIRKLVIILVVFALLRSVLDPPELTRSVFWVQPSLFFVETCGLFSFVGFDPSTQLLSAEGTEACCLCFRCLNCCWIVYLNLISFLRSEGAIKHQIMGSIKRVLRTRTR